MVLIHHVVLVASAGLLLAAGLRVSSRLSDATLERLVAAAPVAASVAAIEAIGLGLVGLGTNPVALFAGAAGAYLLARRLTPVQAPPLLGQLRDWWEGLSSRGRLASGALAGAGLGWTAWLLRYPAFNLDSHSYHIPEVLAWVRNGSPGSLVPILPGYPYEALPVTNEVLLSWGSGIGRSFVWMTIWPALLFPLLAASAWLGLRALKVPGLPAGLATASLCAAPMATSFQLNGPNTDFPALVWLVVAGGLAAASLSGGREGLFLPAVLASALAVGTKTTAAPQVAILLAVVAYLLRQRLPTLGRPLLVTVVGALLIGGTWYVRNLLWHGSPLWPFFATPWGDPIPHLLGNQEQYTFFRRPLESLARFGEEGYVTDTFLGPLVALAGAVLAPVFVRTRAVAAGAGVSALSAFLWSFAPDTGAPLTDNAPAAAFHGSPRLLMPGIAVATLTLALAARDAGHRGRWLWGALLAFVLALNAWLLFGLGFPEAPTPATPLTGAVLGAALAFALGRLPSRRLFRPATLAAGGLLLAGTLAFAALGLVQRHAQVGGDPRSPNIAALLVPQFAQGAGADGRPIYSVPMAIPMLAGDDLGRRVEAIPRREPCEAIERRARVGWVVVMEATGDELLGPSTIHGCVRHWRPVYERPGIDVYNAASVRPPPRPASSSSG